MRYLFIFCLQVVVGCSMLKSSQVAGNTPDFQYTDGPYGQSCIRGTIVEKDTREPLIGATVIVKEPGSGEVHGAMTDIEGRFNLCVDFEGKTLVEVKYIGFETETFEVELRYGRTVIFNDSLIILEDNIELLKPIIYLYPEDTMDVSVSVKGLARLKNCYPAYEDSWQVTAYPDGTILDSAGRSYYGLYWEADLSQSLDLPMGNIVSRSDNIAFLEKSLAAFGLNEREANEFIVFWLPILNQSPYNLIYFSTSDYNEAIPLEISPQPETLIRLMMVYQPLEEPIDISEQLIERQNTDRTGFTVVEWGGTKWVKENL